MAIFRRYREATGMLKFAALDSTSPLGAYLSEAEMLRLARACSIRRFAKGASLPDSPFYLVLDGVIRVLDEQTGKVLCKRKQWSFFSRHAGQGILRLGIEGASTLLVADEEARVLLVSSEDRLDAFYYHCSPEAQEGYDAIVHTNLATRLSEVPFIKAADVDEKSLGRMGELVSYLALQQGEYVFEQGDLATCFYIILKGSAETVLHPEDEHAWEQQVVGGLRVTVESATGLKAADSNGLSDPYATLVCQGKRYRTRTIKKTLSPEWHQSFVWPGSRDEMLHASLKIELSDWNLLGGPDYLGEADVPLAFLGQHAAAVHRRTISLSTQGTVQLKFEWMAESEEITSEEVGGITKGPGETFGVASLVLGEPTRAYGMVAVERSVFLVISQENFEPFMHTHPKVEPSIMLMTKRFLLQRYAMNESSFFHAFSEEELERAAVHAEIMRYAADEVVYHMGDTPKAFYVIAHGEVSRDYFDGSPARVIPRGSYFGEMGVLLPRTPNLATVIATSDSTLITISKEDWPKVVPPATTTPHGKRMEGLMRIDGKSMANFGRDPTLELASTHSAAINAKPHRDLHFTLQVNLLLRLQRADAPLEALLMHPKAQPALFRFAEVHLCGGFRTPIFTAALRLLGRLRISSSSSDLASETGAVVAEFLMKQMRVLLAQIERKPCPEPLAALGPPEDDDDDDEAAADDGVIRPPSRPGRPKDLDVRALRRALDATSTLERGVFERFHEGTLRPADLEATVNHLCAEYLGLLRLAHRALLASFEFRDVVETVGPLDKDVVRRVVERDIAEITEKVLEISPTSEIREEQMGGFWGWADASGGGSLGGGQFELFGFKLSA